MNYFLDSNTCIYFLNNRSPRISARLRATGPEKIRIPSMVKAELLHGAEKSVRREANLARVREFLAAFEIVPFCSYCAETYSVIRCQLEKSGTPIGPADLVIAATVLTQVGTLVTNNVSEFRRVAGLSVDNWV